MQIVIFGKRWFEKTNGNTYHSCEVYENGKFLDRENFTYGYGTHYIHTGYEILKKHKRLPKSWDFTMFRTHKTTTNGKVLCLVSDVGRKKDL